MENGSVESFDLQDLASVGPAEKARSSVVARQLAIGLAMCLVALSVVIIGTSKSDDGVATEEAAVDSTAIQDLTPLAIQPFGDYGVDTSVGEDLSSTTETTIEEEPAEPASPQTVFSANRALCQKVYSNPTAVNFNFAPVADPTSSTTESTASSSSTSTTQQQTTTTEKQTTTSKATTTTEAPAPTNPPTPPPPGFADGGHGVHVPIVMLVVRCCESRNNYSAANSVSSARGAYQFLTGSWAAYGHKARYGVSQAHLASPAQQDEAARITWERDGTRPWNASKNCWGKDSSA